MIQIWRGELWTMTSNSWTMNSIKLCPMGTCDGEIASTTKSSYLDILCERRLSVMTQQWYYQYVHFYRAKQLCLRGLGDRTSVCLSVTRVLCDETKEHTADIMILYERVVILVFWYQKRLVGDVPFHVKFSLTVTHPSSKNAYFDQYVLITSEP